MVEEDMNNASNQSSEFTKSIFTDLKLSLDNNLISPPLVNDLDLSAFANYLLYGQEPKKNYTLKKMNGQEYFPVDQKKLQQFQQLDATLQKFKNDQKKKVESSNTTSNSVKKSSTLEKGVD